MTVLHRHNSIIIPVRMVMFETNVTLIIIIFQLEEPPPPGQVQPGPRAFINLQNKFGDEVRSFIQSTQELIGMPW